MWSCNKNNLNDYNFIILCDHVIKIICGYNSGNLCDDVIKIIWMITIL